MQLCTTCARLTVDTPNNCVSDAPAAIFKICYWFSVFLQDYYHRCGDSFGGSLSVCLSVSSLDVESSFSVCRYILKEYGSSSYMKVIGSRLRVKVTGAKSAKILIPHSAM